MTIVINNKLIKRKIKRNTRNAFLEKSYSKCVEETGTRPFSKKSKLSISLDRQFIQFVLLYVQVEYYQNILKLR